MAKWANALVQDGGTDLLRTRAATTNRIKQVVIDAYSAGDSYATVTGNSCGDISLVAADMVQSGAAGAARVTTFAAKAITLTANSTNSTPDTHIAVVDTVSSEVLFVTDETNNQQLFSGNTFNAPAWTISAGQPT